MLAPSPYRTDPVCPYEGRCGGCTYQKMKYQGQLALKRKQVSDKLMRLGGMEKPNVTPVIGMESPFRYRNKASMPVSTGGLLTKKEV